MATPSIGKRIRDRRRELDLSQNELAKKADIGWNSISTYERGTTIPTVPTMRKLADALNVTTDWLIYG